MEHSLSIDRTLSQRESTLLSSTGFYTLARVFILVLLLVSSRLLTGDSIWPPFSSHHPISILIWLYAALTGIAALGLALPQRDMVARAALVLDFVMLTLLTYFNHTPHDLFYPLYIVPLVGTTMLMHRNAGLVLGVVAALGYGVAFLLSYAFDSNRTVFQDPLGSVALVLRSALMVIIPWLTSGLAERWSASNRRSVELAEEKRLVALAQADNYRDQMRALYEVAYTLSTTSSYQKVLDSLLSESRKLVPYRCGLVLLASERRNELFVAAENGLEDVTSRTTITLGQGPISDAIRSPEPFVVDDLSVEPVFDHLPTLRRCHTVCAVPLRSGMQTYGALVVGSDKRSAFDEEQLGMLGTLTNYAVVALQNAQLIHDLRTERTKLLSKEEEVRHQLARDLHDGPAQALAAITMNIEFVKRLLDRDPGRVLPELEKLGALAKRTTHEVRTMLFELRPLALETQGLDVTLRQYFERFNSETTELVLDMKPIDTELDTRTEGTLFNIIQESVNNALKHARAQHIWVRLEQKPQGIEATVQDDGRGFDIDKIKASYDKRGSFGLLNIEERAALIGGVAEVHSAPGEGTTVRIILPTGE
ncbi:MAG TPA: GAF domain-containing sensor histidine kinase [Roseiflexaceae bacterium]|nr:GAF domain-containing sensor histidine kinase [Roseiflexaceae bacterium]